MNAVFRIMAAAGEERVSECCIQIFDRKVSTESHEPTWQPGSSLPESWEINGGKRKRIRG
ncbi:hypothetical protein D3H55_04220 [Bacillus salacetis]|uniref:Uncharacterized protein n=1 Tax=Bacillus salacetis TaxID=2315464 RepID=A0A3A1R3F9_9BACI|nr:hypothetical protein [Bacillus salacetis]RIW37255.1 hypothetical protein D3H55_04220 [Bacillus salacetis]